MGKLFSNKITRWKQRQRIVIQQSTCPALNIPMSSARVTGSLPIRTTMIATSTNNLPISSHPPDQLTKALDQSRNASEVLELDIQIPKTGHLQEKAISVIIPLV